MYFNQMDVYEVKLIFFFVFTNNQEILVVIMEVLKWIDINQFQRVGNESAAVIKINCYMSGRA